MKNGLVLKPELLASAKLFGCDGIIRDALGLDKDFPLQITVPHGIDFYNLKLDSDVHCHEPIYLALRDDIAERAGRVKTALKFPHPWQFLVSREPIPGGMGTLFIAPPPSLRNFQALLAGIKRGEYPRPWGVLIKERGTLPEHYAFWQDRGFAVHSAGTIDDQRFFYKLRDIFAQYECVASPNMSSAVIFAVAMNRRAFAVPNVETEFTEVGDAEKIYELSDPGGNVARVWRNLLSSDAALAKSQAEDLLGMQYMSDPDELKTRLMVAISATENRPVHLYPLNPGFLYDVCIWLIRHDIPVQRLFPNPLAKVADGFRRLFRLNTLAVFSGSDFAHYGVVGDPTKWHVRKVRTFQLGRNATPGFAIADSSKSFLADAE